MTRERIEHYIPHRGPMLLLDELVTLDADRIVCRKTFREDEFFFQGHYPNFSIVPGVILCECAMQAGAVLISHKVESLEGIPVATRLNNVRFRHMVCPGETIDIETSLLDQLAQAFYLDARIRRDGRVVARLDFACTATESESGSAPDPSR